MAQKFYELDIWVEGHSLLMEIYKIADQFPKEEKFGLGSQSIRSANGVIANIAEAHGRYYFADKTRILYIARGELEETQSHLMVAYSRKYIDKERFDLLNNRFEGLKVGINNYIQFLKDKKNNKPLPSQS